MRNSPFLIASTILLAANLLAGNPPASSAPIDILIPWLLHEGTHLRGVPFSEVIFDATGHKVRPVDRENPADRRVVEQLAKTLDEVVRQLNQEGSAIQAVPRINEVSSHFEDLLRRLIDDAPGLHCDFPKTASGHIQRSGYPDLRIVDQESARVYYLDPKLYAAGSRESSFRTFYFEPKESTNKVLDDAVHFVAGFEHAPRAEGRWLFTRWDLIDLAHFQVQLKAEFQGSNRDLYRPEAVVATSAR